MNKYTKNIITAAILLLSVTCFSSPIGDVNSSGFAVFSGRNLSTGNNVSIEGNSGAVSTTWLANNTIVTGNAYTGTSFSAGNNVGVTGNITYGSSFWMGNNSILGGDVIQSTVNFPAVNIPSISAANNSLWYKKNSTVDLAPGSYGDLSLSKDSTLYLSSGTYDFSNVWLDKGVEIVLNTSQGDVVINSAGSFSTGQNVKMSGDGISSAYIVSGKDLYLGNNNNITASLISNAGISIDNSSLIDGIIYANKDVWLSNNVQVNGISNIARSAIPEPATALLLLTTFPFILKKTRHNK